MLKHQKIEHSFVQNLPDVLKPGVLYISMEFATAAHLCFCGCGEEVVTPFSPAQWRVTFDGETISLDPSVGNWLQSCRSHYVIRGGRVIEAGQWSDEEIEAGFANDRAARAAMFGKDGASSTKSGVPKLPVQKRSIWAWIKAWFK
jgi:hypothetical protein